VRILSTRPRNYPVQIEIGIAIEIENSRQLFRLQTVSLSGSSNQQAARLQTPDCKLPTAFQPDVYSPFSPVSQVGLSQQNPGTRLAGSSNQQAARLQTPDCRLPTADCRLHTVLTPPGSVTSSNAGT
jgi:hypothetical protein